MSKTPVMKEIEYEKDVIVKEDYYGKIVGVIDRVYEKDKDLKPVFSSNSYRVKKAFGENSKIYKSYNQIKSNEVDFVYLIGIYYDDKIEKSEKLKAAYDLLTKLKADVIGTKLFTPKDFYYKYPSLKKGEEVDVRFKVQGLYNGQIRREKLFEVDVPADNKNHKISENKLSEYFEDYYIKKSKEKKIDKDFKEKTSESFNIDFSKNLIKPRNEEDNRSGFTLKDIEVKDLDIKGKNITEFKLNLNGDFNNGTSKGVKLFYSTNNTRDYMQFENNESIKLKDAKKISFKFILNNYDNKDDFPTIDSISLDFNLLSKEDLIYEVVGGNRYINIFSKRDGDDYLWANADFEKFMLEKRKRIYYIKELAQECVHEDKIALIPASRKEEENKNKYFSTLISEIEKIKEDLNEEERKRVGVVLNESYFYDPIEDIRYSDYSLLDALGLFSIVDSSENIANKEFKNAQDVENEFNKKEIKRLSSKGYSVSYLSKRNGITLYSLRSLSDHPLYKNLNIMRIANEVVRKVDDNLEDFIGGSLSSNDLRSIGKEIYHTLEELELENKIDDFSFNIREKNIEEISIQIDINILGVVHSIEFS